MILYFKTRHSIDAKGIGYAEEEKEGFVIKVTPKKWWSLRSWVFASQIESWIRTKLNPPDL